MFSKRDENRARQRQSILDSATNLFSSRGFDAVTMSDIAAKTGVVRATVFNYFPSKHSLVESITEDVFAYYTAIVERALEEESAGVPALLRTLLVHMGEGIENQQQFYSGVFREVLRIRAGLDEATSSEGLRGAAIAQLEKLLKRGQARGELRTDLGAGELARSLDALSMGTIIDWLYERRTGPLGDRMQVVASLFLGGAAVGDTSSADVIPGLVPLEITPTAAAQRVQGNES